MTDPDGTAQLPGDSSDDGRYTGDPRRELAGAFAYTWHTINDQGRANYRNAAALAENLQTMERL